AAVSADSNPSDDTKAGDCLSPNQSMSIRAITATVLKHTVSTASIPFTIRVTPSNLKRPGQKKWADFMLTAVIQPADFRDAPAGRYEGVFTLQVTP
ncbi:MAG TPA: hypothetical protein VLJ62_15350, partial [Burkholderiaceae bacterium]|nr:hypothetical protein [Burkholderiaceae bacterium]